MASPRDIRRLAFQALYQLDLRGEEENEAIALGFESLANEDPATFRPGERRKAIELARGAFAARRDSDQVMEQLAPTWPAHRQPALDRAVLRLAIYEMRSGRTPPKVVVNEAVELAKRYSTEQSPAFINGVLDKVLKQVLGEQDASQGDAEAPIEPPAQAPSE